MMGFFRKKKGAPMTEPDNQDTLVVTGDEARAHVDASAQGAASVEHVGRQWHIVEAGHDGEAWRVTLRPVPPAEVPE